MTDHGPLTGWQAMALAEILDACRVVKVAYVRDDGKVFYGTARCLTGADNGRFPPMDPASDIRDAYLRLTTMAGFELAIPVTDLITAHRAGRFIPYDWSVEKDLPEHVDVVS